MPDDLMPDSAAGAGPSLADAFAALPLETPERSAWPVLAARIDAAAAARRTPRRRGWLLAVAAAAALGAIALLPRGVHDTVSPPPAATVATTPVPAAQPATLDELMAESARLDYFVQTVSDDQANSAAATALALEYEARVQGIDSALSDPGLSADARADLWTRRVDLLREYAGLRGTTQWLAAQGNELDGDLVAVY